MPSPCPCRGCTAAFKAGYDEGYTAGYNDHARTVQHWQDTHGAYRGPITADQWPVGGIWNQHGNGENP